MHYFIILIDLPFAFPYSIYKKGRLLQTIIEAELFVMARSDVSKGCEESTRMFV